MGYLGFLLTLLTKTNPERYIDLGVWKEHFDLMVNTGARDERAKKTSRRYHYYGEEASRSLAQNPGYKWLRDNGTYRPGKPLSGMLHCAIVHNIVTHLLSYVDRLDYAALVYANERNN